ncbi:hypothetical protein GCM10007939_07380 [Amylibacter marinus]|uniref:Malonyl-CoA decarboxylase n=1 Tax=Amylibacter marinus TaxID=1475483 RepID=A0ABQ5VSZ0_9RHOB|nr:malonyl-CoA decarboxylase family protein [Amylibacter marinus]GLQ34455.1 hypothetical protein GCM10007939_07380 [Amylibacter marinus]
MFPDRLMPNPRGSFFTDIMSSLFERRSRGAAAQDQRDITELCTALLTERVEASLFQLASTIFERYNAFDDAEKLAFFLHLNEALDVDADAVHKAAQSYVKGASPEEYQRLRALAEPKRHKLFRRLNQVTDGTEQLVRMRTDLLRFKRENPALAKTDMDFVELFRSWFNRGFLVMREITWNSPATILEKIIAYEAVHEIRQWEELRRRLQPQDRRCFSFFHPAMPDEPLIFVEVALSKGVANSIDDILSDSRKALDESEADTAVFYSISNCQSGLAGVSFGNSLIKQVVRELIVDVPHLTTFVTLSPIPGLMKWAKSAGHMPKERDPETLQALAAQYLLTAKAENGKPLDPVARFHLGNGAEILAIHGAADSSETAKSRSGGAMVNYHYNLGNIRENQTDFENDYLVRASKEVRALVPNPKKNPRGA